MEGREVSLLADVISPGHRDLWAHFPAERREATLGAMWDNGRPVAGWLSARGTAPVAMLLSNTLSCTTVLLGAVAAGANLISIPPPPRGADLGQYATFVAGTCARTGATTLVVDASYLAKLPPLPEVTYSSFDEVLRARGRGQAHPERFVLTQFTSGNAGEPRGVVLTGDRLRANVEAIVEWLSPVPGDRTCSWFPLSHEMGLVGMFFVALAGSGSRWANGGDVVLLSPEMFRRWPASWLEACAEHRATITGSAPGYGFEMAMRHRPRRPLDLSSVRVLVTGAEPVRAETLTDFAVAFHGTRLSTRAICPVYGLSECGLLTAASPTEEWRALSLDPAELAEGRLVADDQGCAVVSSGRPLPGCSVRVAGSDGLGEIAARGPSVAARYADGTPVAQDGGRLVTGDLGFVVDGELYVVGRQDDVFAAGDRKVYAVDLEVTVGSVPGVRLGRVVAVPGESGGVCVVAEHDETDPLAPRDVETIADAVGARLRARLGAVPQQVVLVSRGRLPLSLSGKVRRFEVRAALRDGRLVDAGAVPGAGGPPAT